MQNRKVWARHKDEFIRMLDATSSAATSEEVLQYYESLSEEQLIACRSVVVLLINHLPRTFRLLTTLMVNKDIDPNALVKE